MNTVKAIVSGLAAGCLLTVISCSEDPTGSGANNNIDAPGTVRDIDGNVYQTVKLGNQEWMAENLKTTKYNDGTPITYVFDDTAWFNLHAEGSSIGAYCYHENDSTRMAKYGALYNWHAVNTGKLAPAGWHVPTDAEWTELENYLVLNGSNWDGTTDTAQDNRIGKALAAKTDWLSSADSGAIGNDLTLNNSSGFSAIGGGYRYHGGTFYGQRSHGYWWSATEYDASKAWYRSLGYGGDGLSTGSLFKGWGISVRLMRD